MSRGTRIGLGVAAALTILAAIGYANRMEILLQVLSVASRASPFGLSGIVSGR